jgi:hypothetical protein
VAKVPRLRLAIVKRSDDVKGFVLLPRRWVVERTFSWFGRNRRLAKDFENLADLRRASSSDADAPKPDVAAGAPQFRGSTDIVEKLHRHDFRR